VQDLGPAVAPPVVEWRFRNARLGEERTYQQTELSIEGEARLIGIATRVGETLRGAGYTWGQIGDMFDTENDTGLDQLLGLVVNVAPAAPDLVTDATCVLLGLYPTDEWGKANRDFDNDRAFIKSTVNTTRFSEMLQILLLQNDYQRLIRPFSKSLASAMGSLTGNASEPPAPSPPDYDLKPVELMDDSTEPDSTPSPKKRTTGTSTRRTATPSEP
jgi:hypothetical protein